jgi:hypothetical protein
MKTKVKKFCVRHLVLVGGATFLSAVIFSTGQIILPIIGYILGVGGMTAIQRFTGDS